MLIWTNSIKLKHLKKWKQEKRKKEYREKETLIREHWKNIKLNCWVSWEPNYKLDSKLKYQVYQSQINIRKENFSILRNKTTLIWSIHLNPNLEKFHQVETFQKMKEKRKKEYREKETYSFSNLL